MRVVSALRAIAHRVVDKTSLRPVLLRALLRHEAMVPFGHALAFDPRSWVIKQTEYGFRIWVALGERSISREIMLDSYEREEVAFVRSTVRCGDRVVDVGANIGFFTALLATLVGTHGHVIACEPLHGVADALERTILENGFEGFVRLYRVALDAQAGTVALRHAPVTVNAGAAYLAPVAALPPDHVDTMVIAKTLDELVGNGPCAFVKLDAEGAEPRILMGAARTLIRCKPTILAELNSTLLQRVGGKHVNDVIALMASYGYVTWRLRNGRAGDRIERYDELENTNVIFRFEEFPR